MILTELVDFGVQGATVHLSDGLFALADLELGPPPPLLLSLDHGHRLVQVGPVGVVGAELVVRQVGDVGVPSLDEEVALEEALADGPGRHFCRCYRILTGEVARFVIVAQLRTLHNRRKQRFPTTTIRMVMPAWPTSLSSSTSSGRHPLLTPYNQV